MLIEPPRDMLTFAREHAAPSGPNLVWENVRASVGRMVDNFQLFLFLAH